jgi:asparagine synthase (glutamine-hydrolysing)
MCGIAGIITAPGSPAPDPAQLDALRQALAHRGPDGGGHSMVGRVALVHTRLAIIDVAGGDQPLFAGAAALVGNGEIYNYRELYHEFPGVNFATGSDNELALQCWLRDGATFADDLRGMYAIAIHERVARTVTLSRDPFGIKPLYIAQTPRGIAFASEAQALLAAGFGSRSVRPTARSELLQVQFTSGAETIFPGIHRVLPGETLTCGEGRVLERRRISALPEGPPEEIGEDEALTSICTSGATCRMGCSSRAASTAPRS